MLDVLLVLASLVVIGLTGLSAMVITPLRMVEPGRWEVCSASSEGRSPECW